MPSVKSTFDFDLPLKRYFLKPVADELTDCGISCLDDLLDVIYENPNGWWKPLNISEARANGILVWLYARRADGVVLPTMLNRKAEDLGKTFYGNKEIEDVGTPLWRDLFGPEKSRIPGQVQRSAADIKPLEFLVLNSKIDGSSGTNRGDIENCALDANNDKDAVCLWLKARANNPNTLNAYRREGERFLLWSVLEKAKPLSSANINDCTDYLLWLEMLGRTEKELWSERWKLPQSDWLGPKNVQRNTVDWRPFNCPLSYSSRKAASTIIRQLFSFLSKTGYLKFNPFDQIPTKVRLLPGEGKPKEFADRSLTSEQWLEIENYFRTLPDDIAKARLGIILILGKELGMRASEMLNARCGWIHTARYGSEETLVIDVIGKGDKERRLPISDRQEELINRYLAMRGRPPLHSPEGESVPILASRRPGSKGIANEGLSRSGLYIILQRFLEDVAESVRKERPRDAAKLRAGSLHWLRHTFAVSSLKVMPVNVVQNALGHASVNTTTKYIAPDQEDILEGFKKLNDSGENLS